MKIAVDFCQALFNMGLKKAAEAVKEAGFDAVDFSFKDKAAHMLLKEGDEQNAIWVRRIFNEVGLECVQAHAPLGFSALDKMDEEDEQFDLILRSFRFAQVLGAKTIVVHAVTDVKPVDFISYNLRFYKTLEPYAEELGLKIAIENLYRYDKRYKTFDGVLSKPSEMVEFLQKLKSDVFTVCVDTGHALLCETAPEDYIAGLRSAPIGALHLHDNDGKDDLHLPPYAGVMEWDKILDALVEMEYDGDITLEIMFFLGEHASDEELPKALSLAARAADDLRWKLEERKEEWETTR
ncbi:MAG: sugar phosphate isomerase/epimerase [Clostridia bacterium]|nr:sugar phosphate isomerase/epimerase [Clostridia bacterium]